MAAVKRVTIEAKLAWRAAQSPVSNRWVGVCEELNLAMEADSLDELHSLIPETMHLLMLDLLEDDELDSYLRDKGWLASDLPEQHGADVEFDVPFQLIAEGMRGPERRTH